LARVITVLGQVKTKLLAKKAKQCFKGTGGSGSDLKCFQEKTLNLRGYNVLLVKQNQKI